MLVLAVLLVGAASVAGRPEAGRPTTASRAASGYAGALAWLRAQGAAVETSAVPWTELEGGGTLVVALPGIRPQGEAATAGLHRWVRDGGHLVLLLSTSVEAPASLLDTFRLAQEPTHSDAPLDWTGWRTWMEEQERAVGDGEELRTDAPTRTLDCPPGATVTHRRVDETAAACRFPLGRGQVRVVNGAGALANDRLGQADNLRFLDALASEAPPLRFDEWHHGAGVAAAARDPGPAPLGLALHVGALYLAVAWGLSRPIGPAPRPLAGAASSMLRDLRVLGALHHAGRHAEAAGARLLALGRERLRRRKVEAALPERFSGRDRALLDLARHIGRLETDDAG